MRAAMPMLSGSNLLDPKRLLLSDIRGPRVPKLVELAHVVFCNNYIFHAFETTPNQRRKESTALIDRRARPLNGDVQSILREKMQPGALLVTTLPMSDGRHVGSTSQRYSQQPRRLVLIKEFQLPVGSVSWKAGDVKAYLHRCEVIDQHRQI